MRIPHDDAAYRMQLQQDEQERRDYTVHLPHIVCHPSLSPLSSHDICLVRDYTVHLPHIVCHPSPRTPDLIPSYPGSNTLVPRI